MQRTWQVRTGYSRPGAESSVEVAVPGAGIEPARFTAQPTVRPPSQN